MFGESCAGLFEVVLSLLSSHLQHVTVPYVFSAGLEKGAGNRTHDKLPPVFSADITHALF